MKRGTIVLTPFPFSDLTTSKRRPAVIVSSVDDQEVIVAFISSQVRKSTKPTDLIIEASHPDFSITGLKKSSAIRLRKLCTIEKSIILGELGEVSQTQQHEINDRLRIALQLNHDS